MTIPPIRTNLGIMCFDQLLNVPIDGLPAAIACSFKKYAVSTFAAIFTALLMEVLFAREEDSHVEKSKQQANFTKSFFFETNLVFGIIFRELSRSQPPPHKACMLSPLTFVFYQANFRIAYFRRTLHQNAHPSVNVRQTHLLSSLPNLWNKQSLFCNGVFLSPRSPSTSSSFSIPASFSNSCLLLTPPERTFAMKLAGVLLTL